jgi:hypothetical protein
VREVAKAIPLRTALSVQMIDVVVRDTFCQRLNLVLEDLATKCRHIWDVERQTV